MARRSSVRHETETRDAWAGVVVGSVIDPSTAVASPDVSVESFVFRDVLHEGRRALPVVDGDRLLGMVSLTDVRRVPQSAWGTATLREIMTPAPLSTAKPDMSLSDAMRLMADKDVHQLPVMRDGRVVGLLNRADVLRSLRLRNELHLDELHLERMDASPSPLGRQHTA